MKVLAVPTSLILRELGRHTAASIEMAWSNMKGTLANASADMLAVADELDADAFYTGWRDDS
jgi:hypothetical protein